jgi:hypothetical protein
MVFGLMLGGRREKSRVMGVAEDGTVCLGMLWTIELTLLSHSSRVPSLLHKMTRRRTKARRRCTLTLRRGRS